MIDIDFIEHTKTIMAKRIVDDTEQFYKACEDMERELVLKGYQRVSSYKSHKISEKNSLEIICEVVKLRDEEIVLHENINLPFEDDNSIVGKWVVLGEYAVKEDFYEKIGVSNQYLSTDLQQIYFLPGGERYWCYGWTKNKLLIDQGGNGEFSVNHFTTEIYDGNKYMFVDFKSYYYRRGGRTTVLVLRQLDNRSYTAEEISRKDDINLPFEDDNRVIGTWKGFDYCWTKESFDPESHRERDLFFSAIAFEPNGKVTSWYDFGKTKISGSDMQTWTKGYVLRKWNCSACAYEIQTIKDTEYLIIEWKSGDYRYGGFNTDYYVFIRA